VLSRAPSNGRRENEPPARTCQPAAVGRQGCRRCGGLVAAPERRPVRRWQLRRRPRWRAASATRRAPSACCAATSAMVCCRSCSRPGAPASAFNPRRAGRMSRASLTSTGSSNMRRGETLSEASHPPSSPRDSGCISDTDFGFSGGFYFLGSSSAGFSSVARDRAECHNHIADHGRQGRPTSAVRPPSRGR
jgi:hypothetical protein